MRYFLSTTSPKITVFEQFASVAKAIGHPLRLELLEFLAQGERGVDGLARATAQSVANASHHLQQLRRAGLVTFRKDGVHVLYRLSGDDVVDLLAALRHTGERHNAEVTKVVTEYFQERDNMEAVSREELLRRAKDDGVTVLDVRPAEEYQAGHLPGALNIQIRELTNRLQDLPKDKEVIAYCRGAYCVLSFEAVAALREKGYKVRRLEEGFPEWRAAGLPVENAVH
jgi:ArsR family transcriptional regulator